MKKKDLLSLVERIGFDDKEAKIYIALLELGEATVLEVGKRAGVKRPTAYLVLDTLHAKGAAFKTRASGRTRFIAEKPKRER